ncbi:SDH family Clp fold serine proteinase [Microbulbifer sp. M83]|uniref:SDH family Clp fold serine proteinase n=1 Tax=Microbulbifer sp. M83 TaxID=3118246 RepID=UPI002FDF1C18
MPSLNDVIEEIGQFQADSPELNAIDVVRAGKMEALHSLTGRNVICYYSGWLNCGGQNIPNLSIDDMDKNGFMNAVEGMDCSLGLDLLLHTPGGQTTAAESIVYYLRQKFGLDVRVIIPQMAMSAGTMIACSAQEIVMGHQSCIGPFDPSVQGVSAFAVFDEFQRASEQIKNEPHTIPLWQTMIGKYPPAFLEVCQKAIELAEKIVPEWLISGMFKDLPEEEQQNRVTSILRELNNPTETKEHSRHIHFDKAKDLGLNVVALENDQPLQEAVLTLHHAYMATLMSTTTSKLIEAHHGKRLIINYSN